MTNDATHRSSQYARRASEIKACRMPAAQEEDPLAEIRATWPTSHPNYHPQIWRYRNFGIRQADAIGAIWQGLQ